MTDDKQPLKWTVPHDDANKQWLSALWSEYAHRHAHIWSVVLQTTAVVIGLGVIPYLTESKVPAAMRWVPAVAAAALALFAVLRMQREFRLFDTVKEPYLKLTGRWDEKERSSVWHRPLEGLLSVLCVTTIKPSNN